MRLRIALLAAVLVATTLAGCKSPPTKEEKSSVDYGPRPENYEQIVREYLKTRIKDPASAIVEFRAGPNPLYQQNTILRPLQYGWGLCVFINDKDRNGERNAYPMVFYIRNGLIVTANGGPQDSLIGRRYALAGCNELGTPFITK